MKRFASYVLTALLAVAVLPLALAGPAGAVPGEPSLAAPADGATVTTNPVLDWNTVSAATSYRVQVSASSSFTPLLVNVTTPNTKYGPPTDLPLGVLYWRVAAIDGSGQGPFSVDRTFTKEALGGPLLSSPADGATIEYPTDPAVFSWQPFAGADRYEIQIDTEPTFGTPVTTVTTSNPSYALTDPPSIGQPYYWRVRALSAASIASQYSEERTYGFTWPEIPVLEAPPDDNNPSNAIEEVVFDWTPAVGAVSYDLQVSPSDQFNVLTLNITGIHGTRYSPPTTINNGAYFWRVRARNYASAVGDWSEDSTFYRAWPAPDSGPNHRVTLLTPANGDLTVGLPEFTWTPVRLASTYEIELGTDPNFSPGSFVTCTTQHTSFIPTTGCDPDPGGTYYWRVRPIDNPKPVDGLYSPTFSFQYDPGIPPLLSPANGAALVAPFQLSWGPIANDNGPEVAKYKVTIRDSGGTLVETGTTFATTYVPQNLEPDDGPFTWRVQIVTESGDGIIPGASRTFTFTDPTSFSGSPDPVVPDAGSGVRMPYLEWDPVATATSYEIWRATAPSTVYEKFTTPTIRESGYRHTGSSVTGDFTYFVRALLEGGGSVDGAIGSFSIESLPPATLVGPAHCPPNTACTEETETPTFEWEWNPAATHYRIYLATDPNFTSFVSGYASGVKVHYPRFRPTTNLPDAQAGQATFWYARPCYGTSPEICGAEPGTFAGQSPVRAFRKRTNPVQLLSPVDGASASNEVTFDWESYLATNLAADDPADLEARTYKVELSTTLDMQSIFHTSPLLDQSTYTVFSRTLPDGPVYWRVQAIDAASNSLSFSVVRLVNKLSPQVALTTPAPGAAVTTAPVFTWAAQAHAARYTIEVYKNPGAALTSGNRVINATTPMNAHVSTAALPAGTYGWRVQRRDADNVVGPWSAQVNTELRLFTVTGNAASLLTPANGTNFGDNDQSFTWSAAPTAAQYRFQADDNADFSSPIESVTTVMTSWHSTKVYPNGSYSWRVQTIDGEGNVTATSAVRTFTHGPPPPPTTYYHAITPARILDSRPGTQVGPFSTKWGANQTRQVTVAGNSGVPADAEAVALNVTVTGNNASSLLKIWPTGQAEPSASSINWSAGTTIANAVTVKVGTNERVSVENAAGTTDVIFDIVGYYDDNSGTGGGLTPLTPSRIIDSRPSTQVGPYGTKWGPGASRDVHVTGGSVPAGADSVVLNVTVTGGTTGSFLTIWPDGEAQPTASSINFKTGQTIPNAVTTKVGAGGDIRIFNGAGSVNVIVDVVGYFDQGSGAPFRPLPNPIRIQDSRASTKVGAYSTPWGAGTDRFVQVSGPLAGVPTSSTAVLMNVTVAGATKGSFLTVYPTGSARPTASSLNWAPGQIIANSVTAKLGTSGRVQAYNAAGTVHVIMDVTGYYGA